MDHREIDWERLDRHVCGVGTPAERTELARWVTADSALGALADAMRTVGRAGDAPAAQWNARGAWERVQRRIHSVARAPYRRTRRES